MLYKKNYILIWFNYKHIYVLKLEYLIKKILYLFIGQINALNILINCQI